MNFLIPVKAHFTNKNLSYYTFIVIQFTKHFVTPLFSAIFAGNRNR